MDFFNFGRGADVSSAMRKCPFLHNIAQKHGEEYAASLAYQKGGAVSHKPVLEEDGDFSSTFALFHGRGGMLPLPHLSRPEPKVLYPPEMTPAAEKEPEVARPGCPFASGATITRPLAGPMAFGGALAAAPLASMSMSWGSNWFNIHHLFQQHFKQHRAQQRKPPQQPQQHLQQPKSLQGGAHGPGPSSGANAQGAGGVEGGKCPLRKALGPLAGIVFNKQGHLSCPEPIVKMRAALAATRPVRELRPQALPIKLLAVAMTTAALNVPCGMWREHTEKFSSQWFVAVHATIPFIAMLRKAVIMPKYAILFTICAAIAGQAVGARLERERRLAAARDELGGLARAGPVSTGNPRVPQIVAAAPAAVVGSVHAAAPTPAATTLPVASVLLATHPRDSRVSSGGAGGPATAAGGDAFEAATVGSAGGQRGGMQFRVQMRSGRRLGTGRRGAAGSGLLVGAAAKGRAEGLPVAVRPTAVTC